MQDGYSEAGNSYINFNFTAGNFKSSVIYDSYNPKAYMDYNDEIVETSVDNKFNSFFTDFKYDLKIGENLTLTPEVSIKRQTPWLVETEDWYSYNFV